MAAVHVLSLLVEYAAYDYILVMSEKNSTAFAIVLAFAAAIVLKLFCFDFIFAQGRSMLPTIENGSLLLVNKLAFGIHTPFSRGYLVRWSMPRKGDILIFRTPFGDMAVKRCAETTTDGYFIALGDNGIMSFDSRSYGPVSADNIIGRVVGIK